jgi:hypothetical protein
MNTTQIRKRIRLEIDPDVYKVLEIKAQGFETPNDVLRRLLGLGQKTERRNHDTL